MVEPVLGAQPRHAVRLELESESGPQLAHPDWIEVRPLHKVRELVEKALEPENCMRIALGKKPAHSLSVAVLVDEKQSIGGDRRCVLDRPLPEHRLPFDPRHLAYEHVPLLDLAVGLAPCKIRSKPGVKALRAVAVGL